MKKIILSFLLFFMAPNFVYASAISLSSVIIDFDGKTHKDYYDLIVSNVSPDDTAYVQIKVYEIVNPGMENEEKVLIESKIKDTLLVSPKKLVIPVGEKKSVRIIPMHNKIKKDRVYRVNVSPVVGDFTNDSKTFIKFLVAYDVLTFVRPKKPKPKLSVKREGKKMIFENDGNTNILVDRGDQCTQDEKKCEVLAGFRLYAGNKVEKELPYDSDVKYHFRTFGKSFERTYKK